jgi:2-(1,2-epoxy-1,2-dihydrophenyl)acetyl-CoA isomerase
MSEVLLDVSDGVARLTLNRPDAANGIDLAMANALLAHALDLRGRSDVRVIVLSGAGKRFCAGGDVHSFAGAEDVEGHLRAITLSLHSAITLLAGNDAPVIAAVQGSAAGAGLGLVASSDLVIAAESTKFVMAYTGIGLTPDGSTTYFLPRLIWPSPIGSSPRPKRSTSDSSHASFPTPS